MRSSKHYPFLITVGSAFDVGDTEQSKHSAALKKIHVSQEELSMATNKGLRIVGHFTIVLKPEDESGRSEFRKQFFNMMQEWDASNVGFTSYDDTYPEKEHGAPKKEETNKK